MNLLIPFPSDVQNGRVINSMDFHRTEDFLVTASDDESIRLYNTAKAS